MPGKTKIIAIDGPSSSGKGTLAKRIAAHFKVPHLNTGAIYRLIALRAIESGLEPDLKSNNYQTFEAQISDLINNITENHLDNPKLFNEEIGKIASIIAKSQTLRKSIFSWQQDFITTSCQNFGGCVLDGRDTTSVIAPNADYKFFVTADAEVRAKRRVKQLQKNKQPANYQEILDKLKERDENDLGRKESPLIITKDAHVIDSSDLSIEQCLEKTLEIIKSTTTRS